MKDDLSLERNHSEFNIEKSYLGMKKFIEFDNKRRLFRIRDRKSNKHSTIYQYAHLISAEHFKVDNEVTVTKTKAGSMLGRAFVGGLFFGGVGAIVGGVTAKKSAKSKSKLKKQYIRLSLNSFETPTFDINIKCTTDGKRIADELFNVFQYIVNTTTDEQRLRLLSSEVKPITT